MSITEITKAISGAKNKTAVYRVCKEYGVFIPMEARKMLNLGGIKDYARRAVLTK